MYEGKQGNMHSYYGHYNINDPKPKYGVHLFMLDEYLKRSIDTQKEKFSKEISKKLEDFRKDQEFLIKTNKKEIDDIKLLIKDLNRSLIKIISLNNLKKPELIKAIDKRKKNEKPTPEDDLDDEDNE
jgi:hypothetical protein